MTIVPDPTSRFSRRVNDYVKYRPGYPDELALALKRRIGYDDSFVVADVGSGTGISTRYFLERGNVVFAVEPNPDMRAVAEQWLGSYSQFHSVAARAEATTLKSSSVDLVVAAQSFHWFDAEAAKREFKRIVKPEAFVALLWNERRIDTSAFLREYEQILRKYSDDYVSVAKRYTDAESHLQQFFGSQLWGAEDFSNRQSFDLDGLIGRALSSSYVPLAGQPNHEPVVHDLRRLFERHAEDNQVVFEYATRLFWGRLG